MAATVLDVARRAGVGTSTVVRALRGKGYVSAATKARVLKAAAEMDYHPNHIARSLVLGRSEFVGMVTASSAALAFHPYLQPIEQGIRTAGYSLLFYLSTTDSPDAEMVPFRELISKRVAGVIVAPASPVPDPAPYQMLLDRGVKLVVIDRGIDDLKAPQIIVDHYASARLATEHLISLGHREIVYLAMPEASRVGRDRAAGFRDAMRTAGIPVAESSVVETAMTEEAGAEAVDLLLMRPVRPTAIIARHDIVAIGVMQAILAAGLSIPDDISLIGHGDSGPTYALRVPLTTVRAPLQRMASLAVERLVDMLSGKPVPPDTTVLGVDLIVRSSTASPRAN